MASDVGVFGNLGYHYQRLQTSGFGQNSGGAIQPGAKLAPMITLCRSLCKLIGRVATATIDYRPTREGTEVAGCNSQGVERPENAARHTQGQGRTLKL